MAPPPPSNLPLTERLQKLAQTLQFAWFLGHLTLLLCILRYFVSYVTFNFYSRWAQTSYRLAFVSAAVTYGIVVYKAYKARLNAGAKQQSALMLAADENVQYLLMALVWLCSRQIPLALLPFTVYSVFHVATYTRTNIIPTVSAPKTAPPSASPNSANSTRPPSHQSPLANSIGKFVKEYYDASMTLVALLEISLWFRVLLSAFLFTKGSWVLLVVYSAFLRARYAQSQFVQGAFTKAVARVDSQVQNQSTPAAVRQGWETSKGVGRSAVDATDVRKYLGGGSSQHGTKKPQ